MRRDGEVQGLIVDAGGFLGVGESEERMSLNQIQFVEDADDEGAVFKVYSGGKSTFDQTEDFDETCAEDQAWCRASETEDVRIWEQERASQTRDVELAQITTEELLVAAADGYNDEWVGKVSELTLTDQGKLAAISLDVGGCLGIGEQAVALEVD